MRTILFTLVSFFCAIASQAQLKEKGFFIEASAGYGQTKGYSYYGIVDRFAMIAPSIGYKFNSKWVTGIKMQFKAGDFYYTKLTGYGQYHYWHKERISLFGELQATHAYADLEGGSGTFKEIGLTLGGTFTLTNRLGLILHYGYIGYSGEHYFRGNGACLHTGDFILDGDWRRLLLGVQFFF